MTALPQYDLLEAEGRYADGVGGAVRDVIVKFGDASLIILDHDDLPITHWPLATLRAAAKGDDAATLTLSPDLKGGERLTIADETMGEAIRAVCPDLEQAHTVPDTPTWRRVAVALPIVIAALLIIGWLTAPLLSDRMARKIPADAVTAWGDEMAAEYARLTVGGPPRFCRSSEGTRALRQVTARLGSSGGTTGPNTPPALSIRILDHDAADIVTLPGGRILIFDGLLQAARSPEEIASLIAHQMGLVSARDPARLTLRAMGAAGVVRAILGDMSGRAATRAFAEALAREGYAQDTILAADKYATRLLAAEGLPSSALATAVSRLPAGRDATRNEALRDADVIGNEPFEPALSDQNWIALRSICR